jgi:hypothetical protein
MQSILAPFDAVLRRVRNCIFARFNGFHIDANRPGDRHAVFRRSAREASRIGSLATSVLVGCIRR